jgi:NAD(P)-dependent dehydrogenase (short-subunit alcohol dehydrogenase family)
MAESEIKDQIIVVTGASSGIGAALATAFARHGGKVALLARRAKRLIELAEFLGNERAIAIATDVSDFTAVSLACEQILARWGNVHVLVNNAGVYPPEAPIWRLSPEDWHRTLDTNINGVFYCLRVFLPVMIQRRYGRIVNISSVMVDTPNASAYSISKNAVDLITRILAAELGQLGADIDIIVSSLEPGAIRTEMNPEGLSGPEIVVPTAMKLATLPKGSENGKKWYVKS